MWSISVLTPEGFRRSVNSVIEGKRHGFFGRLLKRVFKGSRQIERFGVMFYIWLHCVGLMMVDFLGAILHPRKYPPKNKIRFPQAVLIHFLASVFLVLVGYFLSSVGISWPYWFLVFISAVTLFVKPLILFFVHLFAAPKKGTFSSLYSLTSLYVPGMTGVLLLAILLVQFSSTFLPNATVSNLSWIFFVVIGSYELFLIRRSIEVAFSFDKDRALSTLIAGNALVFGIAFILILYESGMGPCGWGCVT